MVDLIPLGLGKKVENRLRLVSFLPNPTFEFTLFWVWDRFEIFPTHATKCLGANRTFYICLIESNKKA